MDNQSVVSFSIIQAEPQHTPLIAPLFDCYRQFYGQPSNLMQAQTFLSERLRQQESTVFLAVQQQDGAVQSLGFTQLYPSFSSVALQRVWILNDLFVLPQARNQGIAIALLDAAKKWAIDTHAQRLILSTAYTNDAAQRLYEKAGYCKDEGFYHYQLELS